MGKIDKFMDWFYSIFKGVLRWVGNDIIWYVYFLLNSGNLKEIDDKIDIFIMIECEYFEEDCDGVVMLLLCIILIIFMYEFCCIKDEWNFRLIIVDEVGVIGYMFIFESICDRDR